MGLADLLYSPRRLPIVGKAETGSYVSNMTYNPKLFSLAKTPQKRAEQALELYRSNGWVRKAESTVDGKVANLPWHLEDSNAEEIDEPSGPAQVLTDLLTHPQAMLDPEMRQPGIATYGDMTKVLSRHMRIAGTGFLFKDGGELPTALLIISPTRMYDYFSPSGHLLGWTLDKPKDQGGMPLTLDEVVPFYFDPPDSGAFGLGLAEVVFGKAQMGNLADRHASNLFATGGRLAGIVSPKEANTASPDAWDGFVRDWRNIAEDPDSAKRIQIVKGPIDFNRTAATMQELAATDVSRIARDDIFAIFGVPPSQAGITVAAGLNSGDTKGYDEAILMQGAVHDTVVPIVETIQARIVAPFGDFTFEIEEPSYDDEKPQYEIASLAQTQPLTRNERREILNLDPLPDWDETTGEPLGIAIDLPATIVTVGQGPSDEQRPSVTPPPEAVAAPTEVPPEAVPPPSGGATPAKAEPRTFLGLRNVVDRKYVPAAEKSVAAVLEKQAGIIAAAYRRSGGKKVPGWNQEREERRLMEALRPHVTALADTVTERMAEMMPHQAKADAWQMRVTASALSKVAKRVKDITENTRESIQKIIDAGIAGGSLPAQIADAIAAAAAFAPYRAEVIALTEMGKTYNESSLASYAEFGVSSVEAVDGDEDEECAARDGQTFSLDEADAETAAEHPNGTLDFIPVIDEGKAKEPDASFMARAKAILDLMEQPDPVPVLEDGPFTIEIEHDDNGRVRLIREVR